MPLLLLRAFLVLLLLAPSALAASRAEAPHLSVELLSDVETLGPGSTFTLGIRYEVESHWHVYWKNPGDSGLEPTVRWRLPRGFEAGEIQWPAPELIRLKHLANYGYEGEALLLVDVVAPADLEPGGTVKLSASLGWLVCKEDCIPGQARLELELPLGSATQLDASTVERFTAARSLMPLTSEQAGWSARAQLERSGVHLELRPNADTPLPGEAQFFPAVGGWIHAAGVQRSAEAEGALHLFVPLREDPDREVPTGLAGVAVAGGGWRGEGSETGLAIEVDWSSDLPPFDQVAGGSSLPGAGLAALLAFLGGMLLNLMPCVLPVLSLKILAFARIAGEGRRSAIGHALLFSAGVIATFWIVAAVLLILRALGGQLGWGFQLQSPAMVAVLAVLFTLLALNLFGVFEVGMPAVGGAKLAGRNDAFAAFGSGILATLVATPCTAPFIGGAIGAALVGPWWLAIVVFTAIGAGMAFPYVILAAFPPLLARIPKPGRWMESLRQALGFVLLATVAWLAWVFGHLSDASGEAVGVNGLARLLGGLVLVGLGAWLYGRFAAPSAPTVRRRFVQALSLLVLLWGFSIPIRAVTQEVERLDWKAWSPELVEQLEVQGSPYFLDYTASWCLSCQVNEQVALDTPAVREALERHGITAVKADWTNRDARITQALSVLGRASVPVYVLNGGDGSEPRLLPNILTESLVLDAIEDIDEASEMKLTMTLLPLALIAGISLAPAAQAETKKAPAFKLMDAAGKKHSLADYKGEWVVLEWVNFDCPFVKKQYSGGAMQARQQHFRDEGIVWLSIASSAPGKQGNFSGKNLTARLEKEKWSGDAYLIDADGKVGKAYGAKTTPHMFVVDPQGNIAYEGAIDALRSASASDIFVATNYVVESIEAAQAGRTIPNARTTPYGCSVKY